MRNKKVSLALTCLGIACWLIAAVKLYALVKETVFYRMPLYGILMTPELWFRYILLTIFFIVAGAVFLLRKEWFDPNSDRAILERTANTMGRLAAVIFFTTITCLRWFADHNLLRDIWPLGLGALVLFLLVEGWQKNNYRYTRAAIPGSIPVIGAIILFAITYFVNFKVASLIMQQYIEPRYSHSLYGSGLFFIVILGLNLRFFDDENWGLKKILMTGTAALCVAGGLYLLFDAVKLEHTDISSWNTEWKLTKRCVAGTSTCYEVGYEPWGGAGAGFLLFGFYIFLLAGITFVVSLMAIPFRLWQKEQAQS